MQSDNPSHKAERLLPDDPSAPRMGAYAPPPSETMASAVSIPSGEYNHDLYLNSSHGGGDDSNNEPVFVASALQNDDNEIHLPPLVSFIPYLRFWWKFSRWMLLFLIANCIVMGKVVEGYTMRYYFPVNSWKGWFLAGLWLLTAAWCYVSAKVVDRQVREVEIEAHYEQGRVSENDDPVASGLHPSQMQDKVFGHVSRRLDNFLIGKQDDAPAGPADSPDSDPIHFLMNFAYAMWAILFSAAVALAVATMLGTSREFPKCKNGSSSTDSDIKVDVNHIGGYPDSVQDWINSSWTGGGNFYIRNDDNYQSEPIGDPTEYDFPTSDTEGPLLTAMFPDGTSFFMSNPPAVKIDSSYSTEAVLVLAEMASNSTMPQFHTDILNPRLFLPIEDTIMENSKGNRVASQYCFQATPKSSTDNGNSQRNSWRSRIHTSNIYCIVYNSGSKQFKINKVLVALGDKMYYSSWRSASTGGLYLLESLGSGDNNVEYREVWAVDPASMNATKVYHSAGGRDRGRIYSDDYYYDYDPWGHDTRELKCILRKVKIPSCLMGIVCLVLSGMWLVLREGVPSGAAPIVTTLVCLIRLFTGRHGFAAEALTFNAGFFFLQVALCCGQSPFRPLPNWIGRDMCLWALYAWMMAYLATDLLFEFDGATMFVSFYLVLAGVLQGHPIFWIFGYLGILVCMLTLVVGAFVAEDYISALLGASISLAVGLALLGISTTCSKYNRYWRALSRPFRNVGRSVLYGSNSGPQDMNGAGPRAGASGGQRPDGV